MTFSVGSVNARDPTNLPPEAISMQSDIKNLLDNDIPVIVAAGNYALASSNGQLRTNVDTTPGFFEGPNYPLIVAGAVDNNRNPWLKSQRGPHV